MNATRRRASAGAAALVVSTVVAWCVAGRGRDSTSTTTGDRAGVGSAGRLGAGQARGAGGDVAEPRGTLRVEGQVIDGDDKPVGGATVVIRDDESRTTVTEADGSFAFDGLHPRRYGFTAHAGDRYAPQVFTRVTEHTEPVILRLREGMTVVITVVEADGGAPIAGAVVEESGWKASALRTTGIDGVAEFAGTSDFFHEYEATALGHAPAGTNFMVDPDPGGRIARTIPLARGAPVAGTVLGPDGKPVGGATVSIGREDGRWGGQVTTDVDGRWTVAALAAGMHVFSPSSYEYAPGEPLTVDLDGVTPRSDLVLRMPAGSEISGVVVDARGQPVPSARVYLSDGSIGSSSEPDTADATGEFRIPGVWDGDFQLTATAGGEASPPVKLTVAHAAVTGIRLVLVDGLIAGTVVDEQGQPVPEAKVSAMAFFPNDDDVTDSMGRFELGPLPPGTYQLAAERADVEDLDLPERTSASTGMRDVKLTVAGAATITGIVSLDRAPVADYALVITKDARFVFNAHASGIHARDGRFTRRVLAGSVSVIVAGDTFTKRQIDDVVLVAGKTTDLGAIAVEPGRMISGRVVDSRRTPVAGARVRAGGPPGMDTEEHEDEMGQRLMLGARTTTTAADGTFLLRGMEPLREGTPIHIVATHTTGRVGRDVGPRERTVELVLAPTGSIEGTVRFAPGRVSVMADRVGTRDRAMGFPSANGHYQLSGLVPGRYTVTAHVIPDRMGPTVTAEVKVRAPTRVDLEFPRDTITLEIHVSGDCTFVRLTRKEQAMPVMKECKAGAREIEIDGVIPGDYRACANATCTPVIVTASPSRQVVDLTK